MSNQYPNSGALFAARLPKRSEKGPDFTGSIDLDIALVEQLIQESTDGFSVKLRLSGWKRQGIKGEFISIKYDEYKPPQQQQAAPQQSRQAPQIRDEDLPF